MAIKLGVKEK